jgi:hypothetical protein
VPGRGWIEVSNARECTISRADVHVGGGANGDHRSGDSRSRVHSYTSVRIGRGSIHSQVGHHILCTSACVSKKQRDVFVCENVCCDRVRVSINNGPRIGGRSGSRCVVSIGVSSPIKGERSGHVCGGGCGRLCRLASHGRRCHREARRRAAPGLKVSGGVCGTECVIGIGNKAGGTGRYVGIRIVTRTTGDRHATNEGLSFVVHILVQKLGGSFAPLFVVIDV